MLAAKVKGPPGYLRFQQVQNRFDQTRRAVEELADRKAIVNALKRLDDAISKIGSGGNVATDAKSLRQAIETQ